MDALKAIFSKVKFFESNTMLHAIVFIAQEMNIIDKEYDFDYSLNLPFSESLERDYLLLREEGFILEKEEGHIVVNDELIELSKVKHLISEKDLSKLQKLATFETKDLINISRLIYLCKKYPEIKNDNIKLKEKAWHIFFINNQTFKNVFHHLKNLRTDFAFGEV